MLERAFQRSLESALGGKAALVRRADGAWEIAPSAPAARPALPTDPGERPASRALPASRSAAPQHVPDSEVVAVHVESTGGRSERQRLLWVGLTRVCGGRIEETLETLVNPQARVPQHVARRLDLDLEALAEAPPAADVLPDVRAFIGGAAIAGHNVRAQLSQLNYELLWHGLQPIENPLVDTQQLAAERLPHLPRPALAAAAKSLGVPVTRAPLAGASRVVADVYLALEQLAQPGEQAGGDDRAGTGARPYDSLGHSGQVSVGAGAPAGPSPAGLERSFRSLPPGAADLPELPGVYVFRDADGSALYVGKAASLRARVAQHFTGVSRAVRQDDGLLARVARVEHETTPCELEALLRECALIEAWRPPYNTQRTAHGAKTFLQLRGAPFPRAAARADYSEEGGPCFGPFATSRAVRDTMRTLARVFGLRTCLRAIPAKRKAMREPCIRLGQGLCPAPCASLIDEEQYGRLVRLATQFLVEGRDAALDAIDSRLRAVHAGEGADPERRLLSDVRSRLLHVRKVHTPITGGTAGGRAVLVCPAPSGGYVGYFIEAGELVARREAEHEEELSTESSCWPERDPSVQLTASQRNVLLRWLHQHPEDVVVVG